MKKGLRVLHLVAIRGKGGTGASTASLVEGLARRGHRVFLVCFSRSAIYQRARTVPGVEVITGIYMSPLRRLGRLARDLARLSQVVRREGIELIHTHSSPDTWLGFFLSILFPKVPLVRSRHVPVSLSSNPFNGVIHQRLKGVVAVSHSVKASYLKGKCWQDKVVVIQDGVETERFSPLEKGKPFREEIGLEEGLLILNVSRYAPVKGLQIFLEGVAPVLKRHANAKAVVVGRKREELLPVLEEHAKVIGIEKDVLFLEHRPDIPRLMGAADLLVLSSVGSEGSSRVALEAHSSGRPMVGTRVGAIPEVIDHLHTGVVVPPYDPPAITKATLALMENRRLAKRTGMLARRRALHRMRREGTVDKTEALYGRILGEG